MYEPSPYSPGFSQSPTVLAGRDEVLASADEALDVAALDGRTPAPLVLVGPRGMGKTALLTEVAARGALGRGWPHLAVETPLSGQLLAILAVAADELTRVLSETSGPGHFKVSETVLKAGVGGIGAEVHMTRSAAPDIEPTLRARRAIVTLMTEAAERSSGVVLTLDEAHSAQRDDIGAVGAMVQEATRQRWPLVVVIAGLPALRANRLPSYFERADWHEIGALTPTAAEEAISGPAAAAGRPYEDGAAERLASVTGGYPYAVQVFGHAAWRASQGEPVISANAVGLAIPAATAQLERNLFAQRWEQASPRERQYLSALASQVAEGGDATGAAVARRLGTTTRLVGKYRERLIAKGTLVPEGERLSFVVPGLGGYVLRRASSASHNQGPAAPAEPAATPTGRRTVPRRQP